ncbi:hypothetical protein V1515DRAFT_197451 [Lipomyces mesembrius]
MPQILVKPSTNRKFKHFLPRHNVGQVFRYLGVPYLIGVAFKLSSDIHAFTLPNPLRQLILLVNSYNSDKPVPISGGTFIAIGMFMCFFLQSLLQQQYMQRFLRMGMHMKSAESMYRKALILSSDDRLAKSRGDLMPWRSF